MGDKLSYSSVEGVSYASFQMPLSSNEYLYGEDLTLSRALKFIPPDLRESYLNLWNWFIEGSISGEVGRRLLGEKLPGVEFPHVAQRGIHVPSQQRYAVSVTSTARSIYSEDGFDGVRQDIGDGTWITFYSAHRNNSGGKTAEAWNRGLVNCLCDGIPVGVFVSEGKDSYSRALAYVEAYDPEAELFSLHGPVLHDNAAVFHAPEREDVRLLGDAQLPLPIDEMEEDRRKRVSSNSIRREGQERFRRNLLEAYQGECAITGCQTERVLQAAHIIGYRGPQANVVSNGILMRADLHLLYDSYLMSIEPETRRIMLDPRVREDEYRQFEGACIAVPKQELLRPNAQYLSAHYHRFLKTQQAS